MINVPTVPHNACIAVMVYGKGKCISTYLLYNVKERLNAKYIETHTAAEELR
jgi:predicted aconitase with swiveling domain